PSGELAVRIGVWNSVKPCSIIRRRIEAITCERSTILRWIASRRRSRNRYLSRISSGYSASMLTGNGSGSASERTAISAICSSISPVGSFGLTVSAERFTTVPVTVTTLTETQRRQKPPVSQPIFLKHPITGRDVLYVNPGYAVHIDGMSDAESEEMLDYLFAHQSQPKFRYAHHWTEGDVLMWDNIGTVHRAIADYGPSEHRLMKRCQVMAD